MWSTISAVTLALASDGGVGRDGCAVDEEQDGQGQGRTRLPDLTVQHDDVADSDLLLPAAGANDGVHH